MAAVGCLALGLSQAFRFLNAVRGGYLPFLQGLMRVTQNGAWGAFAPSFGLLIPSQPFCLALRRVRGGTIPSNSRPNS